MKKNFIIVTSESEIFTIAIDSISYVRKGRGADLFRPVIHLKDRTDIRVTSDSYESLIEKIAADENVVFS